MDTEIPTTRDRALNPLAPIFCGRIVEITDDNETLAICLCRHGRRRCPLRLQTELLFRFSVQHQFLNSSKRKK